MISWLKKKKKLTGTALHEDFLDKVEPATDDAGVRFEVGGTKYFRFKKETHMPYGRYKFMETFIKQVDLRLTPQVLGKYLDRIEQNISGEKGNVNLTKVYEAILNIRSRLELTFEMETAYNYASVVFFDDSENLYTYDVDYNRKKIERWREADAIDFFYTRPMSELLGLKAISKEDLTDFIRVQREILGGQTSDT